MKELNFLSKLHKKLEQLNVATKGPLCMLYLTSESNADIKSKEIEKVDSLTYENEEPKWIFVILL